MLTDTERYKYKKYTCTHANNTYTIKLKSTLGIALYTKESPNLYHNWSEVTIKLPVSILKKTTSWKIFL